MRSRCRTVVKCGRKIRGTFRACKTGKRAAKGSLRWKKSGSAWVLLGCAPHNWRNGRCTTGMRALEILRRRDMIAAGGWR